MRSTWWQLAGIGLVVMAAGCSQLPGRAGFSKLGLPSPQATIAASEKTSQRSAARQIPRSGQKQADGAPVSDAGVTEALHRGRALERGGQSDKARKVYETALTSHPHSAPLLHRLGVVADSQKKHAQAEKFFLAALQSSPQNAELLGDLGYCYFLQAKLDQAQAALTEAVALDPASPRNRNNLGLVLGHQKDYDGAFEQFSAAGSQADAYYNMAFVFAAQDLADEAKGCFQEAIAADPKHERAKVALASFEEYERTPDRLHGDDHQPADGNVRYVPYVEGPESGHGDDGVQPASANNNLPASRDVGRTTRMLQLQSRGLLSRHMQQQRQVAQSADASQGTGNLIEVQPQ
jgi:tetratricopeptide (TPR) repeat protein